MFLVVFIAGVFTISEMKFVGYFEMPKSSTLRQLIHKNQEKDKILLLDFCDLVSAPEQHLGLKIKTKAILVVVANPTTDGEAILYQPDCDGKDKRVIVADDSSLSIPDKEFSKLMPTLREPKDAVLARAEVVVTGIIKSPPSHTFRKYKISMEIVTIETVKRVNENMSWPKSNERNN